MLSCGFSLSACCQNIQVSFTYLLCTINSYLISVTFLLADCTFFTQCGQLIGIIMLSVCPSVTLCIAALRIGVEGKKLCQRFPSRQLPIHFFSHFFCRIYHHLAKKHTEKMSSASTCQMNWQQFGKWTDWTLMAWDVSKVTVTSASPYRCSHRVKLAVLFCDYTVRICDMQYNQPS